MGLDFFHPTAEGWGDKARPTAFVCSLACVCVVFCFVVLYFGTVLVCNILQRIASPCVLLICVDLLFFAVFTFSLFFLFA